MDNKWYVPDALPIFVIVWLFLEGFFFGVYSDVKPQRKRFFRQHCAASQLQVQSSYKELYLINSRNRAIKKYRSGWDGKKW
jgi:hypothetical protein